MPKPEYPKDHVAAMRVPKGGSICAKCEYLKDAKNRICGNKFFIAWAGPNKPAGSNKIPLLIDEYCSDWFEPAPGTLEQKSTSPKLSTLDSYLSGLRKKKE